MHNVKIALKLLQVNYIKIAEYLKTDSQLSATGTFIGLQYELQHLSNTTKMWKVQKIIVSSNYCLTSI